MAFYFSESKYRNETTRTIQWDGVRGEGCQTIGLGGGLPGFKKCGHVHRHSESKFGFSGNPWANQIDQTIDSEIIHVKIVKAADVAEDDGQ